MSNKELSMKVREALNAAGFKGMYRISTKDAGYSTSVTVRLKNDDVDYEKVREILDNFRYVSYDEFSGEILAGANIYANVIDARGCIRPRF